MPDLLPAGRTRGVLTTAVILVCAVTVASCSSSSDAPASTTVTPVADAPASTTVPGDATGSAESPSGPAAAASTDESSSAASDGDAVAAALATLDTLAVKGRAPKTGYDRDLFGQEWADVDRNGCDTRNDILARDLTDVTLKRGGCRVLTGTLAEPYTGQTVHFVRGPETSVAVQIDHLVALSDAWQKGAQQLSPERREQLANDPVNLLAVDGPANMQKSDGDAATWLPANKAFRCTYVSRQIDVKAAYGLWVTSAEKDAMVRVLSDCGATGIVAAGTPVTGETADPVAADVPVGPAGAVPEPAAPVAVVPAVPDTVSAGGTAYYANCSAARAAGAAPLYTGQPGYRSAMDRDNDGVACE